MSKKDDWKEVTNAPPMIIEGTALSPRFNASTGMWELVEIEFNTERNYFKVSKITSCGETKSHVISFYNIRSYDLRNNVP